MAGLLELQRVKLVDNTVTFDIIHGRVIRITTRTN